MLSHIENRYQPSYAPWKPNIQSKTIVFVGDPGGLGRATAVMLAAHGAPVFLAANSSAELKQAFSEINRAGGECDGMVIDWDQTDAWRRFFMLAEAWLGGIDAVVPPPAAVAAAGQNLCMQEAIQRMQVAGCGHILHIDLPGEGEIQNYPVQRMASALRRQAREMGLRVTLIEPETGWDIGATANDLPSAEDIARCVLESMAQPFGAEVVLVPGRRKPAL